MKLKFKIITVAAAVLSILACQSVWAGIDPSVAQVKVYQFLVSASTTCGNPISVYSPQNPSYVDMKTSPTIGAGILNAGTYPCVIMVISDQIKFTPSADTGSCVAGTSYTADICRSGSTSQLPDGTTVNCTNGDNKVAVYLSTATTPGSNGNSFVPPNASSGATTGINLASALSITSSSAGKFKINTAGTVYSDSYLGCWMNPPVFSFTPTSL